MRAALAAALLVVACTAPVAPSPTPQPTPTTEQPRPSPTVPVRVEVELRRATMAAAPEGSAVVDVAVGGPGFVAVGFDGHDTAMAWTSPDGETWSVTGDQPAFHGGVMTGIANVTGLLVAVGRDTTSTEVTDGAAWRSRDGLVWERVTGPGAPRGGQLTDVSPVSPGIIAVGSTGVPEDAAATWISLDEGLTWDRAPSQASLEHAFMWTVASTPLGTLAGGWRRAPGPRAALWRTTDGKTWELLPDLPGGQGYQVRSIESLGNVVVAVGDLVVGGRANAWYTTDGASWLRVTERGSFEEASLVSAIALDAGLAAFGGRETDDGGLWTSPDGTLWTPFTSDAVLADAYFTAATVDGDRLVVVGATQQRIAGTGSYVQHAAAWVGTARGSRGP